jgi:predicted nuclease with TOPRIM domain
LSHSFK